MSGLQVPGNLGMDLVTLAKNIEYKYAIKDLRIRNRTNPDYVDARIDFAHKCYQAGYTQQEIANYLGHKDHTTVHRYLKKGHLLRPLRSINNE